MEFKDWSEGYGDGPDIITLDGMELQVFGTQGVIVNLYDYMTEEEAKQKYVYTALSCASFGDKLYGLGHGFNINTLAANGTDAGFEQGWTFREFLSYLENNGSGPEALFGLGVTNL